MAPRVSQGAGGGTAGRRRGRRRWEATEINGERRAGGLQPVLMITLHLGSRWLDRHLSGAGDGRPGEVPGVTERRGRRVKEAESLPPLGCTCNCNTATALSVGLVVTFNSPPARLLARPLWTCITLFCAQLAATWMDPSRSFYWGTKCPFCCVEGQTWLTAGLSNHLPSFIVRSSFPWSSSLNYDCSSSPHGQLKDISQ